MPETTHLLLPYLLASQAQKHVTHNEALRLLDGIVQLSVLDRHLTAPPASPDDGDRYIVASGATGSWYGWDLNVASGSTAPGCGSCRGAAGAPGSRTSSGLLVWTGSAWTPLTHALGLSRSAPRRRRREPGRRHDQRGRGEELLSGLSGASRRLHHHHPRPCNRARRLDPHRDRHHRRRLLRLRHRRRALEVRRLARDRRRQHQRRRHRAAGLLRPDADPAHRQRRQLHRRRRADRHPPDAPSTSSARMSPGRTPASSASAGRAGSSAEAAPASA